MWKINMAPPARLRRARKGPRARMPKDSRKLGEALPVFFRLLELYGVRFEPDDAPPSRSQRLCSILSYLTDVACIAPYVGYSIVVTDPYYSTRSSGIYWYLIKINLFTFGLSRLIVKGHMGKFREVRSRLLAYEVDPAVYERARAYARHLVAFVGVSVSLSAMVLFGYLLFFFVYCRMPSYRRQRHCTSALWLSFTLYSTITAVFTAICFFSFACMAFAFVCCVVLRHNLKMAVRAIVHAPSTRGAAEGFVRFCHIHSDTQSLVELIDTVFSKIPFVVILVQISSVSMVLRLAPSTAGAIDEKIVALCSCVTNVALYCIALLWVTAASKLNQEIYASCRILCHILVHHRKFMGPVWMKQLVLNFLIYIEYLRIKPVGITLGGYTFAEALENARLFQYVGDFLNIV